MLQRFGDTPDCDKLPPGVSNMIMHISLPIGNGNILMGTDAIEQMGFKLSTGNNFYICIAPDSKQEADLLFKGLSAGGKVNMPMKDMFCLLYTSDAADERSSVDLGG